MEIKRLIRVGNSFALIIDRPICRLLDIGPSTPLRLGLEAGRLVVERVKAEKVLPPVVGVEAMTALAVIEELAEMRGMMVAHVLKLHHAEMYPGSLLLRIRDEVGGLREPARDERELDSRRRMAACLAQLRQGKGWDDAIAVAVDEVPMPKKILPASPLPTRMVDEPIDDELDDELDDGPVAARRLGM